MYSIRLIKIVIILLLLPSLSFAQNDKDKKEYDFVEMTNMVERKDRTYDRYRYEFIIKDRDTKEEQKVTYKFSAEKTENDLKEIINDYDYEENTVIYIDSPNGPYKP